MTKEQDEIALRIWDELYATELRTDKKVINFARRLRAEPPVWVSELLTDWELGEGRRIDSKWAALQVRQMFKAEPPAVAPPSPSQPADGTAAQEAKP